MSSRNLDDRLAQPKPLLMDGATGTELARRGVDLSRPSWTAHAILEDPETLLQIHRDYVEAGAEMITANTFRTHARNVSGMSPDVDSRLLTHRAVELAREAAGASTFVAGSVAPLEDCYSPQLTPSLSELKEEHRDLTRHLADAGVDLILIETQITIREAAIAAQCARQTGLPFCVSLTCGRDGNLLSGESLVEAVTTILREQPLAILLNCIPIDEVLRDLAPVRETHPDVIYGAYANTGRLLPDGTWESTRGQEPAHYAEEAKRWVESGLGWIGGCCGTTPQHISALYEILYDR